MGSILGHFLPDVQHFSQMYCNLANIAFPREKRHNSWNMPLFSGKKVPRYLNCGTLQDGAEHIMPCLLVL